MITKVGIDIDNTIWDLVSPWLEWYNILYLDDIKYEQINEYNFFGMTTKATKKEMFDILHTPEFWDYVKPFEDSYSALKKFNNEFELYIVTKTSYKTPSKKFDNFFTYFPFLSEKQLVNTSNKSLLNIDVLIDDYVKNLGNNTKYNFLINTPYNKKYSNYLKVKNLSEAYDIINFLNGHIKINNEEK